MYESPIEIIQNDINSKLEDGILKAVQNIGIYVDKEELLKALSYDRDQYVKGYTDGSPPHARWIKEKDRRFRWHCSRCGYVIGPMKRDANYCLKCGAKMEKDLNDR